MQNLQEHGKEKMRQRADKVSQADFKNMLIVWLFQLLVCWYVVKNTVLNLENVYNKQISSRYGVLRILVMLIMHIQMISEFDQGIKMMKYAVNHPWKFRSF